MRGYTDMHVFRGDFVKKYGWAENNYIIFSVNLDSVEKSHLPEKTKNIIMHHV
jgi:hypothetical protein